MLVDGWYKKKGDSKAHYYKSSKIILTEEDFGIRFLCGANDEDDLDYIRYNSINPEDTCRLCRDLIEASDTDQFVSFHHPNAPKSSREKDQKKPLEV